MNTPSVRTRFAPSPTGNLHIGGLRTALFNWLFAKHHNGSFVVRIEDTDKARSSQAYVNEITTSLNWCGIKSDEILIYQSQREDIYKEYINKLLESEEAYWSDEPNEEGIVTRVVKCKVPRNINKICFDDLIKGTISYNTEEIDDFIIARSDGSPLYNFVVVVDDALMKISHVIRGEEHISNTIRQIILYQALGFEVPHFSHLPLILNEHGSKLSKRDAATAVSDYKKQGFLPEALCNYLARLGWAHKDQEIFSIQELVSLFSLKGVSSSGAMFDIEKLLWVNKTYIQKAESSELFKYITSQLNLKLCPEYTHDKTCKLIDLYKDRSHTLIELSGLCNYIYDPYAYPKPHIEDDLDEINRIETIAKTYALQFKNLFDQANTISYDSLIKNFVKENSLKMPDAMKSLRYILFNGIISSPSLYKILAVLGTEEIVKRISLFINKFNLS